jgi:predicted PurR-regulated permease PerM
MKGRIFMNRIISWLQTFVVRVTLTFSLIGIALFFSAMLSNGNSLQAQASPLTPEATEYQVNSNDGASKKIDQDKVNQLFKDYKQPQTASETTEQIGENLSNAPKTIKESLENAADNVREKLNLDQPIYPGTKEFLEDIQEGS